MLRYIWLSDIKEFLQIADTFDSFCQFLEDVNSYRVGYDFEQIQFMVGDVKTGDFRRTRGF
jgi:hypothetical protein